MTLACNPRGMSSPLSPTDLELAKLRMLEARKALNDYEATHGFGGSIEHEKLEREFSKATETYLEMLAEER